MIRAANVAELTEARDIGQREIAALHGEMARQRNAVEQQIALQGDELADMVAESDTVRGELEYFIQLRDRLGIHLVETRSEPMIVVPEGKQLRPWRVAGLHDLARYNGRMYRLISGG